MKKTLAILLSLALVMCMIPGVAFATVTEQESASTGVTFGLSSSTAVYNGAVQKPTVNNVKYNGVEVASDKYEVEYGTGNYKDAGTYIVTVEVTVPAGADGQGTIVSGTASFEIKPVNMADLTIIVPDQEAGVSAIKGEKIIFNGYQTAEFAGHYTAVRNGTEVTFSGINGKNLTGTQKVTFKTVPSLSSVFDATVYSTSAYDGTDKAVSVYLTKKNSYSGSAYIASYDYDICPKTVKNAGTATITITAKEGSGYAGSITVTPEMIVPARDAGNYNVMISGIPNQTYNGSQLRPEIEVTDYLAGETVVLKAGTDFYVTYGANNTIGADAGSVTVTFMNNYTGTKTAYFDIIDPAKDVSNAYVTAVNTDAKTYTGYRDEPIFTVIKGTATLQKNYDYEVIYTNLSTGEITTAPVNAGTYSVKIRGIGSYSGEYVYEQNYVINKRNISEANVSGIYDTYTYEGTKIEPIFSVYYPYGTPLTNGTTYGNGDYYVTYGSNNTTGIYAGVVYIHGSGNFTGTKIVRFAIAGKSIAGCSAYFTNGVSYADHTGLAIKPAITVKDGYYTNLKEGIDYSVSYKNAEGTAVTSMKDAGNYTIIITGKGNYSGELTLSFTINGKPMSNAVVTLKQNSVMATGSAQKPTVIAVQYGTTTLKSTDYTVSYRDASGAEVTSMTLPGIYTVVVIGKSSYEGNAYATFEIKGVQQNINIAKTAYKVYKDSDSFKIKATASGDGTGFAYVSSNPEVASVSASGVVTIHKLGRAKITVTTTGMTKYEAASDDVYVKVHPDKTVLSRKPWTEGKEKSFRVRWDVQKDTTMYQIRYSTASDFKTYKTKTVTASEKYATQSTRITGLKANTKYYVQVRAIKTVTNDLGNEVKYYGQWANWRSVTTKK